MGEDTISKLSAYAGDLLTYGENNDGAIDGEVLDEMEAYIKECVHEGYLKGYNAGWVKGSRLTNTDHLEKLAAQLEKSAVAARQALDSLRSAISGETS